MNVVLTDLCLIKQRTLTAIVRDEQLGEAAAQKENNRRQRSRLHSYIYDNRIPDPPIVSRASSLPCPVPRASRLPLPSDLCLLEWNDELM